MASSTPTPPPPSRPLQSLRTALRPEADAVRRLRADVRQLLGQHGFPEDTIEQIVLGLDEVLMNACHSCANGEDARVEVTLDVFQDRVGMEVKDRGDGLDHTQGGLPDDDAERGRGLFLIHHTMDEVTFLKREGGGTLVRLVKRK